jgi:type IV secretory pathway TrbF-like protein
MSDEKNPYLDARREWDERFGDQITRAKNWRLMAFVATGLLGLTILAYVQLANRTQLVPYVVTVDELGRSAFAPALAENPAANPLLVRRELEMWISEWRSVVSDPPRQRAAVDRVFALLDGKERARGVITNWYRSNDPFSRSTTESVSIQIIAAKQLTDRSWDIEWTETTHPKLANAEQKISRFRATIVLNIVAPDTVELAMKNPLGVFVTDVNTTAVGD